MEPLDLNKEILNFYMGMTLTKLENLFHRKLQHRHWVIYYPYSDLCKRYYRHSLISIEIPYLAQFDDSPDKRYIRRFYARYLYLIAIVDELAADNLLQTAVVSKLTIEKGYELFVRLTQIPTAIIKKQATNNG